jgi:predicted O-methyltransferase YrrM
VAVERGAEEMSEYKFTRDWFSWAPPVWEQLTQHLPNKKAFLEIGSFEGRSTTWIVENMMEDGGEIICIDTWQGGEEHVNGEMEGAWTNFDYNMYLLRKKFPERKVSPMMSLSTSELARQISLNNKYAFIYIDGSHIAKDVLTDACLAWPLLEKGGFMVFDDYLWGDFTRPNHVPKPAVDAFVNIFIEELQIAHVGYQLVVRKTK